MERTLTAQQVINGLKYHPEELKAYCEGKDIECADEKEPGIWYRIQHSFPTFEQFTMYRVKPKPEPKYKLTMNQLEVLSYGINDYKNSNLHQIELVMRWLDVHNIKPT